MQPRTRILIIEDEEILAENLRDFLLRRDAEVQLASSAEAAFDQLTPFQPDLVVIDYSLPGMNGLDGFSRLKSVRTDLRGILISGHPADRLLSVAGAAGIEQVLTKPFAFSELERALFKRDIETPPGGDGDERRATATRRARERRSGHSAPAFPLGTIAGWVSQDRRMNDRRNYTDRRLSGFNSLCFGAG